MTLPILASSQFDDASSTLAAAFHHSTDTVLTIQPGDIARFGSPSAAIPLRFRLIKASQIVNGIVAIGDPSAAGTYRATGASGSTLTGVTFESGTAFDGVSGDVVAVCVSRADLADIHAHLAAGPLNVLAAAAALGLAIAGDGVTDDAAAIQAVLDAHPGRAVHFPRTISQAAWVASGGLKSSYYMGSSLTLSAGAGVVGDGGVNSPWTFRFAPRVPGLVLAAGCLVRDMALLGSEPWIGVYFNQGLVPAGRLAGVTEAAGASAADGIRVAGPNCLISDVSSCQFGRDGINISAADQGLSQGQGGEDSVLAGPISCDNNRGHGIYVQGGDSNCIRMISPNVNVNQFWGINQESFLAGTVTSAQADQNATDGSQNLTADDATAAVASLVRSANVVTMTWAAPYTSSPLHPGDGVKVVTCTDASFLGRWRVLSVSVDNLTVTYAQVAADASVTGGTTARANYLPPDFTIQSAVRASGVVTLTSTAAVAVPVGYPTGAGDFFKVGQGVTLVNCPTASFDGTGVVLTVSTDGKTVTFAQTGPDASIASGTVRMALPEDVWQLPAYPGGAVPEILQGGSYRAVGLTSQQVWDQPYAEGGQRNLLGGRCLVLNPTWSDVPDPTGGRHGAGPAFVLQAAGPQFATPVANQPIGIWHPYDGMPVAVELVGATANQVVRTLIGDVTDADATVWEYDRSVEGFTWSEGDAFAGGNVIRLALARGGATRVASAGTAAVLVNKDAGAGTGGMQVGGPIACAAGDTAGRPTGVAVAGSMYYDITIHKPVFFDGSAWRDAAGTIV